MVKTPCARDRTSNQTVFAPRAVKKRKHAHARALELMDENVNQGVKGGQTGQRQSSIVDGTLSRARADGGKCYSRNNQ